MSRDILTLPAPPADHRINYGSLPDQFGDLRVPSSSGPHPVAVVVHGGTWSARHSLEHVGHLCEALRQRGVATWNIEFRRVGSPDGGWPNTFIDVGRAADHLRVIAADHALDMDRVIATGHSSGGHLALWLGARSQLRNGNALYGPDPLSVGAVVALAAIGDLRARWGTGGRGLDGVESLMGGTPDSLPDRYATASPAEMLPLGVRQILLHGTADEGLPIAISENYVAKALAAGDDATMVPIMGAGHFELIDPRANEWTLVEGAILGALTFDRGRAVAGA